MENNILSLCAYHESGRVVFAYLADFFCSEMTLSLKDPGKGYSGLNDGGQHTYLINQILYEGFKNVNPLAKNEIIDFCTRLMDVYCAGACARAHFEHRGKIVKANQLVIPNQDQKAINAIQRALTQVNAEHDFNFPEKTMTRILHNLNDPVAWKPVKALANAAINSYDKRLSRLEIGNILISSGMQLKRT